MRIISWNCNGKFREKFEIIEKYNADIYVIQECENPAKYKLQFDKFYKHYYWYGEKDSKGLGIFIKDGLQVTDNQWPTYCLRHFISLKIDSHFDLLCVWASPPYIEEYYIYQAINLDKYSEDIIVIGDFNSNAIWDKSHGKRNHSAVVNQLSKLGLFSAYHYQTSEKHGEEKQKTFYAHRHIDKGYHIDYCFANPKYIKSFQIFIANEWLNYSDHVPIQLDTY